MREFNPGETFNEVGALDDVTNAATAVACHPETTVIVIPGEQVRRLADKYPALSQAMMLEMARKLRYAMDRANRLGLMDVKARLCARLLEAADGHGTLRTSQTRLAEELGTVRQVVGRALNELQRAGIVATGRGGIKVLDRNALKGMLLE